MSTTKKTPRPRGPEIIKRSEARGVLLYLSAEIASSSERLSSRARGWRLPEDLDDLLGGDQGELVSVELTLRQWAILSAACRIAAEAI